MSLTEVLAFASGAVCVWLVVRQNIWNFPVGIANNILFVALFLDAGLYADTGLQVVYIALAGIGWFWWLRGGSERTGVVVREPSPAQLATCLAAVAVITVAIQWGLHRWTDSSVAGWDALTTALSLVAQFMLSRKWIANWWLWIAADLVYIPLYAHKGLWLTSGLYVVFLAMCVTGLVQWRAARADLDREPATAGAAR